MNSLAIDFSEPKRSIFELPINYYGILLSQITRLMHIF